MQRPHNLYKDKTAFTQVDYLTKDQVRSIHDVSKLTKNKKTAQTPAANEQTSQDVWYCKKMGSLRNAVLEVVAQEFFRFISPQQPKTRVVEEMVNGVPDYYVISKEIKDPNPLTPAQAEDLKKHFLEIQNSYPLSRWPAEYLKNKFEDGTINGLGVVSVLSLLLNEMDLRMHNLHISFPSWQTLKIDGDACFKRLRKRMSPDEHKISPDAVSILPFLDENYLAYNFFDIIKEGRWCESVLFDPDLDLPSYRQEINATLLKALFLPKEFFTRFIRCYTDDADLITEIACEFEQRQADLKTAAFCSTSFNEYMLTTEAAAEFQSFLATSKAFRSTGKNSFSPIIADFEKDAQAAFECMRSQSEFYLSSAQTRDDHPPESSASTSAPSPAQPDFRLFAITAEELALITEMLPPCSAETPSPNPRNRHYFFTAQEDSQPLEEHKTRKRKGFE